MLDIYFLEALPSIISCATIAIFGWMIGVFKSMSKKIDKFSEEHEVLMNRTKMTPNLPDEHKMLMEVMLHLDEYFKEHKILMDSQRNQIKADIVCIYEKATERGYITPMELDTLNRMADSYFDLGGNHYIHVIVKRANEMPIKGEQLPV